MKRILFVTVFSCLSLFSIAQQETADLGIFLGAGTSLGDYTSTSRGESFSFDYKIFYRYNFNSRVALRLDFLSGDIKGKGLFNGVGQTDGNGNAILDENGRLVELSFGKSVTEISISGEVNYLDFLLGSEKRRFSPFISLGVGLAYYLGPNDEGVVTPSVPVMFGAKYSLTKNWGVGVEVSLHKLFDDRLDDMKDPYRLNGMVSTTTFWHNNDWTSYCGVTVWYKIYSGKKECPAYDSLN